MTKYKSWDDVLDVNDEHLTKVYSKMLNGYDLEGKEKEYVTNTLNFQQKKAKEIRSKKSQYTIKEVVESMFAFGIFMYLDNNNKKLDDSRKELLSKLSDDMILNLWDILSFSLEVNDCLYFNLKYVTDEKKEKYSQIYDEVNNYLSYLKIEEELSELYNLKSNTYKKIEQLKHNFIDYKSEKAHLMERAIDLLNISKNLDKETFKVLNEIVDNELYYAEADLEIDPDLNKIQESKEYLQKKNDLEKNLKTTENKIKKLVKTKELKNKDEYKSCFPFQSLASNQTIESLIVSNLLISKNNTEKYHDSVLYFVKNLLLEETVNRGLMSQSSILFASPYILLNEDFSNVTYEINDCLTNLLGSKRVSYTTFLNLNDNIKKLNIILESLDVKLKKDVFVDLKNIITQTIQNVDSLKNLDLYGDNSLLESLLLTYETCQNSNILSAINLLMDYRENKLNEEFEIKSNNWDLLNVNKYNEILKRLENKFANFKETHKSLYYPSTQIIQVDEVFFTVKASVEIDVEINDLIGSQNKAFENKTVLTSGNFINVFSKYWKVVCDNDNVKDFIKTQYEIKDVNDKKIISFIVKSLPNVKMENDQIFEWGQRLLSFILIEKDYRNLKDCASISGEIEFLAQKEILKITNSNNSQNKTKIKKF